MIVTGVDCCEGTRRVRAARAGAFFSAPMSAGSALFVLCHMAGCTCSAGVCLRID